MKKLLLLIMLLFVSQINVYAFQYIDERYPGNGAYLPYDFPSESPYPIGQGLGGMGNGSIVSKSLQFTVSQYSTANYLSVSGILNPNLFKLDAARSQYRAELRQAGFNQEEITEALKGFVGPPQSLDVNFAIIKGSVPYRPTITSRYIPMPTDVQISKANYTFFTDNSLNAKNIKDILIPLSPFETQLEPNQDYWVRASLNHPNIMTFQYSTKLVGESTVPEPATILLLGGGLAGAIWRRRKFAKT